MKAPSLKAIAALSSLPLLFSLASAQAQTAAVIARPTPPAATAPTAVPNLVPYSGLAQTREGKALTGDLAATFLIFKDEQGGEPLWVETQSVTIDPTGRFQVQLGASSSAGLPASTFATGEGRWLEVQISGQEPQPRILLSSVPYAMKASDAETLGGLSARNFVTQSQLASAAKSLAAQAVAQITPDVTLTGTGVTNYVPVWTSASNLGDSVIYQSTTKVGINTTAPTASLHVVGPTNGAIGMVLQSGAGYGSLRVGGDVNASTVTPSVRKVARFSMPDWAADTQGVLLFSGDITSATTNDMYFGGATGSPLYGPTTLHFFTSPTSTTVGGTEKMTITSAGNVGISAQNPTAKLEVNGTTKFDGLVTFASGQTFPGGGGGTITGITTTSPLTGSGTSGSVALGLNTTALETTEETAFDSRYAVLSGGNVFSQYLTSFQTAGPGYAAMLAWGSSGSIGSFGDSDTTTGVEGESSSGQGVYGFATSPAAYTGSASSGPVASAGVQGGTGSTFSSEYANEATVAFAGVWGDTSSNGSGAPVGLFGTADNGYGLAAINKSTSFPGAYVANLSGAGLQVTGTTGYGISAVTTSGDGVDGSVFSPGNGTAGVYGTSYANSNTSSTFGIFGGVWGDTGESLATANGPWPVGVIGTADDSYAGVFLNNSTHAPTIYAHNYASGGATGLFKTFMATSDEGTCGIAGGSMSCTGPIKSLATTDSAHTVETYAVQSPESWMEDVGSDQLRNGVAVVTIEPTFAKTISGDASYKIFLTPNGDSKGLYVIAKTPTTFEVRESGGGTSTLSFDYRIIAKRRGYEAQRLVDVTEPFIREIKTAELAHLTVPHARPARTRSTLEIAANAHKQPLPMRKPPVKVKPVNQAVATARH